VKDLQNQPARRNRWSESVGKPSRPSGRKAHRRRRCALPKRRVTVRSGDMGYTIGLFAGDDRITPSQSGVRRVRPTAAARAPEPHRAASSVLLGSVPPSFISLRASQKFVRPAPGTGGVTKRRKFWSRIKSLYGPKSRSSAACRDPRRWAADAVAWPSPGCGHGQEHHRCGGRAFA